MKKPDSREKSTYKEKNSTHGKNSDPREKTFFPGEKSLISKIIILTHEKKKIDL